jgi:hypothetical protein
MRCAMPSGQMTTLGRLASRIVVGTAIYVAIIALAAPLPAAAGLMLTFPALNGLAFYFSEDDRAAAIAKTMFWMPIVNGAFCAAYIMLFLLLASVLPPTTVGWTLFVIAAVLWFAWVSREHVRAGIDRPAQLTVVAAATFGGLVLAAATMLAMTHFNVSPPAASVANAAGSGGLFGAIAHNQLKIALFAATLTVFVAAVHYFPLSDSTRGILGGLPIVPFGGLLSIAGDSSLSPAARIAAFLGMIDGVWLGPPVALWFIFLFSRYLSARKPVAPQAADSALRFGALLFGWFVTFAVLVALAYALRALSESAATLSSTV